MPINAFLITTGSNDGSVECYDNFYPPVTKLAADTNGALHCRKDQYSPGAFDTFVTLARWDTSSLPDTNTIANGILRVWVTTGGIVDGDGRNLVGEYYTVPSTIVTADWTITPGTTAFDIPISSLVAGAYNDIPLTNPDANVSKTGYTGLRIGISGGSPAGNNRVSFSSYENTIFKSAPQLVITHNPVDQSTFTISSAGDDACWGESVAASYPPPGTKIEDPYTAIGIGNNRVVVGRDVYAPTPHYSIAVGLLRFDTSSIPDGHTITSAYLRLRSDGNLTNSDSRSLGIESYDAGNPSAVGDFTMTPSSAAGLVSLSSLTVNAYNDIPITNPDTNINKSGFTGFRLHITGGQPTVGANRFAFYAYENYGDQGFLSPQLVVTHESVEHGDNASAAFMSF